MIDELRDGRTEPPGSLEDVIEDATAISAMAEAQHEVDENRPTWEESLGAAYRSAETDWDSIHSALAWTRQLRQLLEADVPTELRRLIERGRVDADADELEAALEAYRQAHGTLTARFGAPGRKNSRLPHRPSRWMFLAIADDLSSSMDRLGEWTDFYRAKEQLKELGWARFLNNLIAVPVPSERVVTEAEVLIWTAGLDLYFEDIQKSVTSGGDRTRS